MPARERVLASLTERKRARPSAGMELGSMIKNVGIVGAGQMGCGIAQVSATAGYKVHVYDISADRVEAGLATINGNMARQVSSGKLTDDERKKALSLIKG